ncbi:DUF732 domain-containing protein [Mycobacterium sp.]|uniref:DUF732 domain-containing protein n=1 Tax=Mycobacterium sp. TaxID=1785 RepID=UPI003C77F0E8
MRMLLALLGVSAAIGLAPSAYADPDTGGTDDAGFLASLQSAGITYQNADGAIAFAKAVCGAMGNGKQGPQLVSDLQTDNPGLTSDHAASFLAIAAKYYCPARVTTR